MPKTLSRDPERRPIDAAYAPLLYEMAALRLFEVVWPEGSSYCRSNRSPTVHFRAELEYAGLVAHHLQYLDAVGALSIPWRVSLVAHVAGPAQCSFTIAPLNATGSERQWTDLRKIGAGFDEQIRRIAKLRLRVLDVRRVAAGASPGLTPRESEVLELFLAGLAVASIAKRLFVSPHTVRNHIKRLFAKFGVRSQRELREHFSN